MLAAQLETTTAPTPRLMRLQPKISLRLLRNAVTRVAQKEGLDYMTLENLYNNVRSALVHLLMHDRFRTYVEDNVAELVRLTEDFLSRPGVEKLSTDKDWVSNLAKATANLDKARVADLKAIAVSVEDVRLFLKVIEANREAHAREHYDPSDIITPRLYALAHMIARNFEAYEKTLNT